MVDDRDRNVLTREEKKVRERKMGGGQLENQELQRVSNKKK